MTVVGAVVVAAALAEVSDRRGRRSRRVPPPPAMTSWTNRSWPSGRSRSGTVGTREKGKRA
jgi:hypothetical protein